MISLIAQAIGGLGIFFAGMYLLTENLKKLTGRRFRQAVAAWTKSLWAGILWGLGAGAVMQSTPAITFIVVSMLGSGLLSVESGLAIIIGCNVGTTLIVVIAALDIRVFILVMLGLAGLSFASERLAPVRSFFLAVFGIGLVFLGLEILQDAAAPLAAEPWMGHLMSRAGSSFVLAFLIGAVLSVVTQSTNSVALLAITLADAGVLTFDQCVMAIYGANVGSSVLTYMLSTGLRGRQRQVAMYQVSFNFVAALVMVPLFYLEVLSGIPLAVALVKSLTGDPTLQLAYIHVVFNIGGAIVLTPFVGLAGRILARRYPPPPEESEARPQYLYDQAVMEPETALDLVELEQRRLAGYLPRLLDIARDPSKPAGSAIASRQQTIAALEAAIDEFLDRLGEVPISHAGYERLNQVLAVSRILDGLAETLGELVRAAAEAGPSPATRRLIDNVVEGLDAVLTTVVEAMGPDGSGEDRILLRGISGDRSALMRRLREEYLASDASLGAADKMTILTVTNLTERASWLISRLIDALPPVTAATPRSETAAEAGARSP
jgi:phosphate:Na+ symporter